MTADDLQLAYLRFSHSEDLIDAEFTAATLTEDLNIEQMGQELFTLLEKFDCSRMVLGLERVEYITSAALGKLITLHRRMHRRDGRLVLFGLQGSVAEVMKTSRLLDYFNVAPDHNSAVSQA